MHECWTKAAPRLTEPRTSIIFNCTLDRQFLGFTDLVVPLRFAAPKDCSLRKLTKPAVRFL
jgi:hypothetical protein